MLYDNGQLAGVYAEALRADRPRGPGPHQPRAFATFCSARWPDPAGGFYTAIDADSEGEEGKFYRWEKAEVEKLLTPDEYELFARCTASTAIPNFEEKFYVPQLAQPLAEIAAEMKLTEADLEDKLAPIRKKLYDVRAKRPRPLTDTKLLAADNGLAIGGLADAGRILKEPRYVAAARRRPSSCWRSFARRMAG